MGKNTATRPASHDVVGAGRLGGREASGAFSAKEPPAALALDNNANTSRKRSARWAARSVNWTYSALPRCQKCGRYPVTKDGTVGVRADGVSVGFSGLSTCGSVWSCPVCNSRIQNVRRLEVGVALANLHANGGGAAFGAVTVRHNHTQPLDSLLSGLVYGIARIGRDKGVKAIRDRMGYLGRIQALEVTHGRNGWHPHRHPLALFSTPPNSADLLDLHMAEFRAFRAGVVKKGFQSPLSVGQFFQPVDLGEGEPFSQYFTKASFGADAAGWELTSTQSKAARKRGSRTPWQLLEGVLVHGDMDDLVLWNEYELALKGRRALTYTRGLRDLLGLGEELTDETIAEQEVGDDSDTGFKVTDWSPVSGNASLGAGLLNAVTASGNWAAGREFCRANGIAYADI